MSNPADPVNVDRVRTLRARYPNYTNQDLATLTGWDLDDVNAALGPTPEAGKRLLPVLRTKEVAG